MHSMNKAYVMKLGWGIIHDNNNLWADVLRSKYVKTQDHRIPQVQAKGKDSPLWKTICKVWPQVIEDLGWSAGNGVEVRFWKDNWLEGISSKHGVEYSMEMGFLCSFTPHTNNYGNG